MQSVPSISVTYTHNGASTTSRTRWNPVVPRERFLVPRFVVDDAVERIKDGTITDYVYDPKTVQFAQKPANLANGSPLCRGKSTFNRMIRKAMADTLW